uniref:Transmembrane protein n=1 Tax=Plectus sambesii TaxID=2011161 RepID=A0A914WXY6_9BILA
MALTNEQKRVVSVDTVQMVIVAWALAWHAVTDMFLMFLIVVDAERQTDSHVIELRLALSIVGMIGVLIRHPPFMSIAVGSLLQAAMHNFFIIVGHSALLLKGGDFVTRTKLRDTDSSIISDVLRLVCIALWTLALMLAAITVALKYDDVAPPSQHLDE